MMDDLENNNYFYMKPIDYKTLLKNIDTYEEEICRVFEKLHKEDLKAKTDIVSYGSSASFERVEWDMSDETNVSVRYYDYYYDLYDSSCIKIPVSILFNDEDIDRWIQGLITDRIIAIAERKRKVELEKEERERAEYERLKIRYGGTKQ